MSPLVLIGFGVLILAVGLGLGYLLGNTIRSRETAKASDIEAELNKYRSDVTEHFNQTAAHFQSIGQQYRELYDHMALGAEALCETPPAGRSVPFSPDPLLASDTERAGHTDVESDAESVIADSEAEAEEAPVAAEPLAAADPVVAEESAPDDAVTAEAAEELAPEKEAAGVTSDDERIYH